MPPHVSVIVPCYNERATIGSLLEALQSQTFPREQFEVVVADGMSTDGTREVIDRFARDHPDAEIHVIDNPERSTPSALNRAIAFSRGEIILRLDAHSVPAPDYVDRCLDVLAATRAANVGGVWDIRPSSRGFIGRSIAAAVSHLLGAGDARYRTGGPAGPVDTVPFGAYPRFWLEKVGGYDENLLANEDYDLNVRLRQAGGVVWLDPQIRSVYFSRSDFRSLVRQYSRYGFWKARMLLKSPGSLRWRQAAAPMLVITTLAGGIAATMIPEAAIVLAVEWSVYLGVLLVASIQRAWKMGDPSLVLGMPAALVLIHLSWGLGFWEGLASAPWRRPR